MYICSERWFMFPIFYENSRVPSWIGKVAPIKPYAVCFFIFVWSAGPIDERLRRHETIHWKQQLECLFIGQWVLYAFGWLVLFFRFKFDGRLAYYRLPFEMEAYDNDENVGYLINRPKFAWVKYIKKSWSLPDEF